MAENFTRADVVNEHRTNFDRKVTAIIDTVTSLQKAYAEDFNNLEDFRKERDAIIAESQEVLEKTDFAIPEGFAEWNDEQIGGLFNDHYDELSFTDKEELQVNLVRIQNRTVEINNIADKLINYSDAVSRINAATLEPDHDKEVVLDTTTSTPTVDQEPVEEYVGAHQKITPEVKEEVVKTDDKKEHQEITDASKEEVKEEPKAAEDDKTEVIGIRSASQELVDKLHSSLNNTDAPSDSEEDTISEATPVETEDKEEIKEKEENLDYVEFEMPGNISLGDIAEKIYGEKDYWLNIYYYNRDIFEKLPNLSMEDIAEIPAALKGVTLRFPRLQSLQDVKVQPLEGEELAESEETMLKVA